MRTFLYWSVTKGIIVDNRRTTKKIIRDENGITEEKRMELVKEMGDVLWYLANLSMELDVELEFVATRNIEKLKQRQNNNKLHGYGDNR